MARASGQLTYRFSVKTEDGSIIPWDSMTEERKAECRNIMLDNLSRHMSDYYSAHPDEYEKLRSL